MQAYTRYQSDYGYRRRVDEGMTPVQLAEFDAKVAEEKRALVAQAPRSAPEPGPTAEPSAVPAIADERHGSTSGYAAGCRLKEACPGVALVGRSCTQAATEYQREVKRRKRAENGATAPGPSEAPAEPADDAPALLAVRDQLAKSEGRVAELEGVLSDREQVNAAQAKRIAELTDRVASLELELDVAKSAREVTLSKDAQLVVPPREANPSRFRFQRDDAGGVVVDVDGEQPGFVRFDLDQSGALVGVAVQSGK
ncbi:hypothetical protein [Microcella frigidaquae]|uniref:Uncharacterized protein n=1 Tax=Microcella frigidaquae TaxID=424758 RepID=A0A840XKP2_9MICO|nr:hypothetical protein [Microcella frigidaquae]MBB5617228.1 hypothetical protein [Microcella frigidaquae]NHN45072.1 hypothetical protein [Microcella frigidaquae]